MALEHRNSIILPLRPRLRTDMEDCIKHAARSGDLDKARRGTAAPALDSASPGQHLRTAQPPQARGAARSWGDTAGDNSSRGLAAGTTAAAV